MESVNEQRGPGRSASARRGLLVGLTGGIAAGKSTVAEEFARLGAGVLDADKLAHRVLDDPEVLPRLVQAFGRGILDEQGRVHRGQLGAVVFADPGQRAVLERITHPRIADRAQTAVHRLFFGGRRLVVYEAALLVETGRHRLMDRLVVVRADDALRLSRLRGRNHLSEAEARRRLESQLPQDEKVELADYVVDNSTTRQAAQAQVRRIWHQLTADPPPNGGPTP